MNASLYPNTVRPFSSDRGRLDAGFAGARFDPVSSGLSGAREQLQVDWLIDRVNGTVARDPGAFRQAAQLAFGAKADASSINALIDAARADTLPVPPVRFVDEGALGTNAFGAWDGQTIYLDRSLLNDSARLEHVFVEELGHSLDTRLGGADAPGDEGDIFARTLLGEQLSPETLASLRAENDHGTIDLLELHARPRPVEFDYGYEEAAYGGQTGADNDRDSGGAGNDGEDHNDSSSDFNPNAPQGGMWEGTWEPNTGGRGNDGEEHNGREPIAAAPERGGRHGDFFIGVDVDLTVFGGGEFTFGRVWDLDTPSESGSFFTSGGAGGGNLGIGATAGYFETEIEGGSSGVDANLGLGGVAFGRGDDGGRYGALSVGFGGGISSNHSNTTTIPHAGIFGRSGANP